MFKYVPAYLNIYFDICQDKINYFDCRVNITGVKRKINDKG